MKIADRIVRWLVNQYPEQFQRAHGAELADLSALSMEDARARQGVARPAAVVRLLANLTWGLAAQFAGEFRDDMRLSLREMRRSKVFAITAILSLSMAAGTAISVYSTFKSTIFRTTPGVASPETLVTSYRQISYPAYRAFVDPKSTPFAEAAAFRPHLPLMLRAKAEDPARRVWAQMVSPNYFGVAGVRPHRGRLTDFSPTEAQAVLSHSLWQTLLHESESTVGQSILVNGKPVTIMGVAAPQFHGTTPMFASADIFVAANAGGEAVIPEAAGATTRNAPAFIILGRLKPGVSRDQAELALDAALRQDEKRFGVSASDPMMKDTSRRFPLADGGKLIPMRPEILPMATGFPTVLALLVLWVACANLGAVLLARASASRRSVGIRLAMGASRGRIVRQMLAHSLILSTFGALFGLLQAVISTTRYNPLPDMMPGYVRLEFSLDWTAVLVTFAVILVTTLLCGLGPALHASRVGPAAAIKNGDLTSLPRFGRFSQRNMLIVQQVMAALSTLMLTGFVLLAMERGVLQSTGFPIAGLSIAAIDPLREGQTAEQTATIMAELPDKLRRETGVENAGVGELPPLAPAYPRIDVVAGKIETRAEYTRVGPGYLESVGVPLHGGRAIARTDARGAVINDHLARELFPAGGAVGQTFSLRRNGKLETWQVAGVVGDVKRSFMFPRAPGFIYLPLQPADFARATLGGWTVVVRGSPGVNVPEAVRRALPGAEFTVFDAEPVQASIDRINYLARLTTWVYGSMGAFGILLAAVGLAGVTAYAVTRRTREIGIRVALGARSRQVLQAVLGEAAGLLLAGLALGLATAVGLERMLHSYMSLVTQVGNVHFTDPLLMVGAPLLMAALAVLACIVPARRAVSIQPTVALRDE